MLSMTDFFRQKGVFATETQMLDHFSDPCDPTSLHEDLLEPPVETETGIGVEQHWSERGCLNFIA